MFNGYKNKSLEDFKEDIDGDDMLATIWKNVFDKNNIKPRIMKRYVM